MHALQYFETLCTKYTTWNDLKTFLTSAEGGSLRVVESELPYAVIRYVKGESLLSNPDLNVALFRSVIWNTVTNRPVCVAPVKAVNGNPPLNMEFAQIQDFVDGVMVQAFVDAAAPTVLQLSTRTQIGANNTFYSEKTFGAMFGECLASTPVRTTGALLMQMREMASASNASVFASFVIQHPEHRIVAKVASPDLNIVHMGLVSDSGAVSVLESSSEWPSPLRRLQIPTYPVKSFKDEEEIKSLMRRTAVQTGYRWQGLVFKDGEGLRWRIRSTGYLNLRGLRGGEAKSVDRFLRLRKQGNVVEYLKHYAEDRTEFWNYESELRSKTTEVLKAYITVHKAHKMKFAELPVEFKPCVHLLHADYISNLRPSKMTVQLSHAIAVVNGLKEFEQKRLLLAEHLKVVESVPVEETQAQLQSQSQLQDQTANTVEG